MYILILCLHKCIRCRSFSETDCRFMLDSNLGCTTFSAGAETLPHLPTLLGRHGQQDRGDFCFGMALTYMPVLQHISSWQVVLTANALFPLVKSIFCPLILSVNWPCHRVKIGLHCFHYLDLTLICNCLNLTCY